MGVSLPPVKFSGLFDAWYGMCTNPDPAVILAGNRAFICLRYGIETLSRTGNATKGHMVILGARVLADSSLEDDAIRILDVSGKSVTVMVDAEGNCK